MNEFIRIAIRNEVKRTLVMKAGKIVCQCRDDKFNGVPCRHAIEEPSVTFKNLLINKRWRLDFYQEQLDEEPDILSEDEEDIDPQEKVFFFGTIQI